jgi:hypothetical protein
MKNEEFFPGASILNIDVKGSPDKSIRRLEAETCLLPWPLLHFQAHREESQ